MMNNERGIAMPMALIVMVILTALMAAFAVLATSEPQIASNQVASAQARALAESGVERILWALTTGETTPTQSGVIVLDSHNAACAPYCIPTTLPAAYNGTTENTLGVGSFKVTVTDGAQINSKNVTAVGFVPNATSPVATKKIQVTVTRIKWIDPVCALCAGGEQPVGTVTSVQVGGSAATNATTSTQGQGGNAVAAGADCPGVTPQAAISSTGTVSMNGTPSLYSPGPLNTTLTGAAATKNAATYPSGMLLTDSDMATLRAMAQSQGTYWKGTPPWSGGSPPSNGLLFVDTTDGLPLTNTSNNGASLTIHSNVNWSGWLVVAGSIDISGNITMSGLIYSQNDVTLHGSGAGSIQGAIISTNRVDTSSTNIDTENIGNAPISYNCPNVRSGGGTLSQNWFLQPGTYREVSGS